MKKTICSKCEFCKFHEGSDGKNYHYCDYPGTLRVVLHYCRRNGSEHPKNAVIKCPKVNQ